MIDDNDEENSRRVYFNISLPLIAIDKFGYPLFQYKNNKLRTSKYTILSFIPGNLYEQFHRVANLFFAFMVTMQVFPIFGVVNPIIAGMPLCTIIFFTALKDGYEDLKRHREDNQVNNTEAYILDNWINTNYPKYSISPLKLIRSKIYKFYRWINQNSASYTTTMRQHKEKIQLKKKNSKFTKIKDYVENDSTQYATTNSSPFPDHSHTSASLNSNSNDNQNKSSIIKEAKEEIDMSASPNKQEGWKPVPWKNLRVGDIVLLGSNEPVPADIVILSTSESENECYTETKNLDGETTLKRRNGKKETQGIRDIKSAKNFRFVIKAEAPNINLYNFRGTLEMSDSDGDYLMYNSNEDNIMYKDENGINEQPQQQPQQHQLFSIPSSTLNSNSQNLLNSSFNNVRKSNNTGFSNGNGVQNSTAIMMGGSSGSLNIIKNGSGSRSSTYRNMYGNNSTTNKSINICDDIFPNGKQVLPLDVTNLLLRGSTIRNTEWVIGAVIYTGEDTKIRLNSGDTPYKRSRIEKLMNPQVIFNFLILFVAAFANSYVNMSVVHHWNHHKVPFFSDENINIFDFLHTFGATMIMMQNVVPISLYISVEIVKTIQAWFIHEDIDLYYEETDSPCNTKTWNISDDLGQIEYIFSDKTGTLTQNKMDFMRCSIIGKIYGKGYTDVTRDIEGYTIEQTKMIEEEIEKRMQKKLNSYYVNPYTPEDTVYSFLDEQLVTDMMNETSLQGKAIYFFFRHLAICHSVLSPKKVVKKGVKDCQDVVYCAESPDEQALVTTARNLGFTFLRRTEKTITINCFGKEETYEVLHLLEFNSTRKRMSVIVRTPKNEILLLCKGADSVIYERLQKNQDSLRNVTFSHLEKFGSEGLRTLCIAYKYINPMEYQKWKEDYHKAEISLSDRDRLKEELASAIERNLVLLGATAIEDKLQEGVPDCIGTLQDAGIKIWVLTGDKLETAINIGFASNLLNRSMCLLAIREGYHSKDNSNGMDAENQKINDIQTQLRNTSGIINKYSNQPDEPRLLEDEESSCCKSCLCCCCCCCCTSGGKSIFKKLIGLFKGCLMRKRDDNCSSFSDNDNYNKKSIEMELKNVAPKFESLRRRSTLSTYSNGGGGTNSNVLSIGKQNPEIGIDFALIIDGQSLQYILDKPRLHKEFLRTATKCRAVICCRVSPKQKSEVVHLVKDGLKVLCLSIGDGANDISMIQEANIGVGIAGQEGMQAAMSSDYALCQFRYLSKLLLVHGRWSYYRVSNMVMNFFYKNIVWVFALFWYQFLCGFSAHILFDYTFIMFFNFLFASLPVLVVGVFDVDISADSLMSKPQLYKSMGIAQHRFTWRVFLSFVADAIYQSLVCFFVPYTIYRDTNLSSGLSTDGNIFGCIVCCYIITIVNLYVGINMRSINYISAIVLLVEILSFLIYFPIYSSMPFSALRECTKYLFTDIKYWMTYIVVIIIALTPRMLFKYIKSNYFPSDVDIIREEEKYNLNNDSIDNIYEYVEDLNNKSILNHNQSVYSNGSSINLNIDNDLLQSGNTAKQEVVVVNQGIILNNSIKSNNSKFNSINSNRKINKGNSIVIDTSVSVSRSDRQTPSGRIEKQDTNSNITNLDQLINEPDYQKSTSPNVYDIDLNNTNSNYYVGMNETSRSGIKMAGPMNNDDRLYGVPNSAGIAVPGSEVSETQNGKLISLLSSESSDTQSLTSSIINLNVSNIMPLTPLSSKYNTTNNNNYINIDKIDKRGSRALSIRSSRSIRSRRNQILKQGSSADGHAMSVIFMDSNVECVNTGFAFSYNDENELISLSKKNNPMIHAKSVDELYSRKMDNNRSSTRRNHTYNSRRLSQPDPSIYYRNYI